MRELKTVLAVTYSLATIWVFLNLLTFQSRDPTEALGKVFLGIGAFALGLPWSLPSVWSYSIVGCEPSGPCPAAGNLTIALSLLGAGINMGLLWWWVLRKAPRC